MNFLTFAVLMLLSFGLGLLANFKLTFNFDYQPAADDAVFKERIKYVLHDAMMPLGVKNADAWNGALFEVEHRLCEEGQHD